MDSINNTVDICNQGNQPICERYKFDHVFDQSSSQDQVYKTMIQPYIKHIFEGHNIAIYCYGLVNTGKTFNMFGQMDYKDDTLLGIFPRTVKSIFSYIENPNSIDNTFESDKKFLVRAKFASIYHNDIFELLDGK